MKRLFFAALTGTAIPTFWLSRRYQRDMNAARARLAAVDRHLMPKGFVLSRDETRYVSEFIDSLFPVSPEGVDFDAFVSNADVNHYNLEAINVPTLIVHTKDDQVASHGASKRAAERIPGARFVSLESGGHLMLGQTTIIRDELAAFFAERRDRTKRVAS
jgi:pimeloyl-ACP methyl ester carboxylesterase